MLDYDQFDGLGLADLVRRGEVTPGELLDDAIARLEAVNPALNAVTATLYDQARAGISGGVPGGPFAGVPFLLKDIGVLLAGTATTNGSRLFASFTADHDSEMVRRYKAAGLVIFGKTNTPEFGLSASTEPQLFGPTHNPWRLDHSPGGSSGGAAAAVAGGIVPMAHGSDGGGSIRMPASCCGLFGLKPTRGRTPSGPDLGESVAGLSIGHAITRTVRDSAALLDAVAGPDIGDPYHAPVPEGPFLGEVGAPPGRLRIAVSTASPRGDPVHSDCVAAVEDAAGLCADLGHEVSEAAPDLDAERLDDALLKIWSANTHNIVRAGERALGRAAQPGELEAVSRGLAERGAALSAGEYVAAVQTMHRQARRAAAFFTDHDILLTPVLAAPPVALGVMDMNSDDLDGYLARMGAYMPFTSLFNATGQPAMSVPLYWNDEGLPIGTQFAAGFGAEATLFRLAAQLEEARPWHQKRPPDPG